MSEQSKCEWYADPFSDTDGRCLAPAVAVATLRSKVDGKQRQCPRCAEHMLETNAQWTFVGYRRLGAWVSVAVFTEGQFAEIKMQPTVGMARTFIAGATMGAGHYAGSLSAYVLPWDAQAMAKEEKPEEVEAAVAALNKAEAS